MEYNRFNELLRLVQSCIFHSQLKDGTVVSGVHVNLPVNGGMEHLVNVERRMICETARDARNEEEASVKILANQIAYILEHGMEFEKPVFQENENADQVQIGKAIILLDRARLSFASEVETKTEKYLDLVVKNEKDR